MSLKRKVYLFKAPPDTGGWAANNDHCKQFSQNESHSVVSPSTSFTLQESTDSQVEHQQQLRSMVRSSTSREGDATNNEEDRFITLLNSLGIEGDLVAVLGFQFSNLDTLWEHLRHPDQYSGIIFTSPRCVTSVVEAVKVGDSRDEWASIRGEWASKRMFCVGPSTSRKVEELWSGVGLKEVITGDESHAESLAKRIIDEYSENMTELSLLYPCGAQRRDVLPRMLREVPIKCSELVVYESVKEPSLSMRIGVVTDELKAEKYEAFLCFFSPSGVKYVFESLDPQMLVSDHIRVISVGPTTKVALEQYFASIGIIKTVQQCKEPTPDALVELLTSMENPK